jgi:hypothetical protein
VSRVILLADSREPIRALIREALASFESSHPEVRWSCLGLDATPVYGNLAVSFDTRASSESRLSAYGAYASFSAKAVDDLGKYNNNCVDFKYALWRELKIDAWTDSYFGRNGEALIIDTYGERVEILDGDGDERYNEIVFPFLRDILKLEALHILASSTRRDDPCRIGVQMCDSDCVEFWTI